MRALKIAGELPINEGFTNETIDPIDNESDDSGRMWSKADMARTRLRGLEIAGIQMGIEVPETCDWEWPDGPVADFTCLPRDPEVHIGLRVGETGEADLGGERYALGAWTFEIARRGADWLLGLSRRGQREQLAVFNEEFTAGEITLSRAASRMRSFPLRTPIDEWIVLHRTVARGGICLTARAAAELGGARIDLGVGPVPPADRWRTPSNSFLGRNAILIREDLGRLRTFRTPWSAAMDERLPMSSRVVEINAFEETEHPYRELLDGNDAAELLVQHAIVPVCDENLLERVLRNAQRIALGARVARLGEVAVPADAVHWTAESAEKVAAPSNSAF
ncbi:MAG: hypothetical protein AB8G23_19225 [Myxococcota bacterium]